MNRDDNDAKDHMSRSCVGASALQAFFKLAEAWSLSEYEQMELLGLSSPSKLDTWQAGNIRDSAETPLSVFLICWTSRRSTCCCQSWNVRMPGCVLLTGRPSSVVGAHLIG